MTTISPYLICLRPTSGIRTTSLELLAPTTCRVAMMIAAKNGAVTTATAAMTIVQKAQGPGNFINADQTFLSKANARFNILLNILQSSYIAMMFL